jgi:hypothetical protein
MTYTARVTDTLPVPVEPAVLSIHIVMAQTGNDDRAVYIPWKNCTLVHAYAVTTVAEGDTNPVYLDLELDAASGSMIGKITIAQDAGVGDVDEIASIERAYVTALDRDDSTRDAINIEATSASTTSWEGTLFMYFERDMGY